MWNESSPEHVDDPWAGLGLPDDEKLLFGDWDIFGDELDFDRDHSFAGMQELGVGAPVGQQCHRRAISTPMRISPQGSSPCQTPVAQLPVAQSTFELNGAAVPAMPVRPMHRMNYPMLPRPELPNDEAAFLAACNNPNLRFNPRSLGFIPATLWADQEVTFGDVVTDFFQRKNNANSRFSHKLFNALRLGESSPLFPQLVGVMWLNQNILRVDKRVFARLLGIKSIDGSLFHQQGNFPSHGFIEIGAGDASRMCPPGLDLTGVDFENVRLLIHGENLFKRGCTESDIEHCKWASARPGK